MHEYSALWTLSKHKNILFINIAAQLRLLATVKQMKQFIVNHCTQLQQRNVN